MGVLVVAVAWIAAMIAVAWWVEADEARWRRILLVWRLLRLVRRRSSNRSKLLVGDIRRGVDDGYAGFLAASNGIPPRYVAVTIVDMDVHLRWSLHRPSEDDLLPGAVVLALGD